MTATQQANRPIASISLDLDNQWAYMRGHGLPGWESYPSYLSTFVPIFLEVCDRHELQVTVFVVGRDAEIESNHKWIKMLVDQGHEISNHSYLHEPWLHQYTRQQLCDDLDKAESALEKLTGKKPKGFRGPGFSVSADLLEELAQRNYEYDASTFPTFVGPLLRAIYFRSTQLSDDERDTRNAQFGQFRDGFQRLKPYNWQLNDGTLVEVPVTTMPVFRVPIHFTYLNYLAQKSLGLARTYSYLAMLLCRMTKTSPSILLHPLDFLASDLVPELHMFPGIGKDSQAKQEGVGSILRDLQRSFDLMPVRNIVEHCKEHGDIVRRELPR